MSIYRVYLRDFQGRVTAETKTVTHAATAAAEAFSALVNRTDLDGQKLAAVLSYNNGQLAFHRFDRFPGQADYWRDRLDEIEWPEERPVLSHGGAREGAGRVPETTDGGQMARVTVTMDSTTRAILTPYGDGNLSEGIRRAARAVADKTV